MSASDEDLARLLRRAQPVESVAERQAYEALLSQVADRPRRALTLARYVLLKRIAAGGLGMVFSAYDPELDRKVAIKLLRAANGPAEGHLRLHREAQALAKLAHPNVVAVYDVGTYDVGEFSEVGMEGHVGATERGSRGVFVVMELVEGETLAEWMQRTERGWADVVNVFLAAGRGLSAAHGIGIVHRDFKPSNVSIGPDGRVRVLDFGLARMSTAGVAGEREAVQDVRDRDQRSTLAVSDDVSDSNSPPAGIVHLGTPITGVGAIMGTPLYMSPEQQRGGIVDHRTDQYAFCAALYEALSRAAPFVGTSLEELLEVKERGQLAALPRGIPGWLQHVLARGLAPNPAERYPHMDALLLALQRDPVARGRRGVAVVALGVSILGVVLGYGSWQRERVRTCEASGAALVSEWGSDVEAEVEAAFLRSRKPFAAEVWATVRTGLEAFVERWTTARVDACMASLVRGEIPQEVMARRILCLDGALERFRQVTTLFRGADGEIVGRAVDAVIALPDPEACLLEIPSVGSEGIRTAERELVVAIDHEIARAESLRMAGKYRDSRVHSAEAIRLAKEARDEAAEARAQIADGMAAEDLGATSEAELAYDRAFTAAERGGIDELATQALLRLSHLIASFNRRLSEAERLILQADARMERMRRPSETLAATSASELGLLRAAQGRYDESAAAYERALEIQVRISGERHPAVASIFAGLAEVRTAQGRLNEAESRLEAAKAIWEAIGGPQHPRVAELTTGFARVAILRGEQGRAVAMLERSLQVLDVAWDGDHEAIGRALHTLGYAYQSADQFTKAIGPLSRARDMFERLHGPEHPLVAIADANLAVCKWRAEPAANVVSDLDGIVARLAHTLGETHPTTLFVNMFRARVLIDRGGAHEAADIFARALIEIEAAYGSDHPRVAEARSGLGLALLTAGEPAAAIEPLQSALEQAERMPGILSHAEQAEAANGLERARAEVKRSERAAVPTPRR